MAVMRVEKNQNYTTMSNYHLQDTRLTLKAIGLLSKILSLPDDWDYTVAGLASICKEGKDAVRSALEELETAGYIERRQTHAADGSFAGNEYIVYESPADVRSPLSGFPSTDKPSTENPLTENPTEQNTNKQNTKRTKTPISPAVMKRFEDYAGDDQELLQRLAEDGLDCFLAKMPANLAILDMDRAEEMYTRWAGSSAKTGSTKGGGRMNITLMAAVSETAGQSSRSAAISAQRRSIMIAKRRATTLIVDIQGMSLSTRS